MYELMITTNANNKKFSRALPSRKKKFIIIDKTENLQSMSSSTFFGIERRFLAMNGDHLSSERAGGTMTLPTYVGRRVGAWVDGARNFKSGMTV